MRRFILPFSVVCGLAFSVNAAPALRILYSPAGSSATLYWTTVAGAVHYDVERTQAAPAWTFQTRLQGTVWSQSGLSANQAYVYRIVPRDSSLNPVGPPSNGAILATHNHAQNPLTTGNSTALQHMTDLRAAITAVSEAAGAGTPVWTRPTLVIGNSVNDEDVLDLRNAFRGAALNLGLAEPSWTDPSLAGQSIKRVHFQQLRDFARAYPEWVSIGATTVTQPYFSPNADGIKDSSTFSTTVSFVTGSPRIDFRWRADIRNAATAIVRSTYGAGLGVSVVWDGTNNAGTVQPDGPYTFELVDVDSLPLPIASGSTRIDLTAPTATIASPTDNFLISNVRTGGGTSVTVTGTVSDETALDQWTLEHEIASQSPISISNGTTAISGGTVGTWQTNAVANARYTIRLRVTDMAGNASIDTVPVTVGHFSASRSRTQANAAAGETVVYTSVVPFALQERLEIRSGSTVVRTLFDGARAAATFTDVWDGLDTAGQLVGDGVYTFVTTLTEGTSTLTWDRSAVFPASVPATQFPYPKCWTGTGWAPCDSPSIDFGFDPYAGKPLRFAYCVGAGEPDTGCSGSNPALVIAKVTATVETTATCDSGCFFQDFQASGRHEVIWYGATTAGSYVADLPRLTVIRGHDKIAESATLIHGTAPVITSVSITPPMFGPASVPMPVGGQVFTLNVTRFAGRPVGVTATFRNMNYGSVLRTITVAPLASDVIEVTWDGRADNGERVAPGRYHVMLTVMDSHGSRAFVGPLVLVRY